MEKVREYLNGNFKISEFDWNIFSSKLLKVTFPKNHILLRAGEIENHLYFIEKGIVRSYIPKEEIELTFDFGFENGFMSGYSSFLTQTPAVFQIKSMTEVILYQLTYDDLQLIYRKTEIGNIIGRKTSEKLFLRKSKRELSLLNETAKQRYLNLFKDQPELIKLIPLKHIASYIGVTPQALSRIRKEIT